MEKKRTLDGVRRAPAKTTKPVPKKTRVVKSASPKRTTETLRKPVAKKPKVEEKLDVEEFFEKDNFSADESFFTKQKLASEMFPDDKKKTVAEEPKLSKKELRKQAKEKKAAEKMAAKNEELLGTGKKKKRGLVFKIGMSLLGLIVVALVGGGIWVWLWGDSFIREISGDGSLWGVITGDSSEPLQKDKNGRTNILIVGTESIDGNSSYDGAQLADTIIVASINQDNGDLRMFSLPRDLRMPDKYRCTATAKINETFWCNYSPSASYKNKGTEAERMKNAATAFKEVVGWATGVDIQYYVHVNWEAVKGLINAVGGVDVLVEYTGNQSTVTSDLPIIWATDKRGIYDVNTKINLKAGETYHLNGQKALDLARARGSSGGYGLAGSNYARERNQQTLITAAIQKAKGTNFVTDLAAALQVKATIGDNIRMDFADKEYKTLMKLATKVDLGSVAQIELQSYFGSSCGESSTGSYISWQCPTAGAFNYSYIHSYLKKRLDNNPAVAESSVITVLNGSGVAGAAADEAERIEDKGLSVAKIGNLVSNGVQITDFAKTTLYVLNRNMPATYTMLKDLFNTAEIEYELPSGVSSSADFVVVIGKSY